MNIRLSLVRGIDGRALFPLATLIHSYIRTNPSVKTIEICQNSISFSKGFFSSTHNINYSPYQIACRNGVIHYDGEIISNIAQDNLFTLLVNVLHQLRPSYVCKI